ncbi:MAG: hypothetical protein NTW14_00205 [bacterium]|nr:hypothetical protein [bacterium]
MPQPHWHVDSEIMLTISTTPGYYSVKEDEPANRLELSEIPKQSSLAQGVEEYHLDMNRVHLPMGGWNNCNEFPACWNSNISDIDGDIDFDNLLKWSEMVLRLITSEFKRINLVIP